MVFEVMLNYLRTSNSINDYLIALGIFLFLLIVFKIFDSRVICILKKACKKTRVLFDDALVNFLSEFSFIFYAYAAFYLAVLSLTIPDFLRIFLNRILIIFIWFYVAKGIIGISNHSFEKYKLHRKKNEKKTSESMMRVMMFLVKILIWSLAFLMILSNLGINITPLVASLGIGGLAIGFALQNILGDLFSAFAIYLDKPFEEGDFIIVGNDMGVVKHIGIKTTRVQALGGQELIFSNSELTSTRINNYKKMNLRRVLFNFGVEYSTPVVKLKKIKKIVESILNSVEGIKLDRVHFKEFSDSSLTFEVVYYVNTNDYNIYMNKQEEINLKIKESLEKEKVNFAFPTRTIYMQKE